jgi:hypothetical protein
MTEHNHFKQIEIFETKLIIQTWKLLNKARLKLLCEVFHNLPYTLSLFTTLAWIIKRFKNGLVVHSHGSKAGPLEVEVKLHELSRSFLSSAFLWSFWLNFSFRSNFSNFHRFLIQLLISHLTFSSSLRYFYRFLNRFLNFLDFACDFSCIYFFMTLDLVLFVRNLSKIKIVVASFVSRKVCWFRSNFLWDKVFGLYFARFKL